MNKEQAKTKKDLAKLWKEADEQDDVENLVEDNVATFKVKDQTYREMKPTYEQKQIVRRARNVRYFELCEDPAFKTREELTEFYKKTQKIDINKFENQLKDLQKVHDNLGERALKTKNDADRKSLKEEQLNIKEEISDISIKKRDLFDCCIENELMEFVNLQFIHLILEKQIEGDKWEKVFKTFNDLMKSSNDNLIFKANYSLQMLMFQYEI